MSKVQKRLSIAKLKDHFKNDSYLQFVTKSGVVHHAKPIKIEGKNLQITNAMRHILYIPLLEIDEVWFENKV